jgi:hypothetical protein
VVQEAQLMWLWVVGYVVCFLGLMLLWPVGIVVGGELPADFELFTKIYSPYLLPIVVFWLVRKSRAQAAAAMSHPFAFAVVASALFNFTMLAFVVGIYFQPRSPGGAVPLQTLQSMAKIAGTLSFLVAPAIGYFFGKKS